MSEADAEHNQELHALEPEIADKIRAIQEVYKPCETCSGLIAAAYGGTSSAFTRTPRWRAVPSQRYAHSHRQRLARARSSR